MDRAVKRRNEVQPAVGERETSDDTPAKRPRINPTQLTLNPVVVAKLRKLTKTFNLTKKSTSEDFTPRQPDLDSSESENAIENKPTCNLTDNRPNTEQSEIYEDTRSERSLHTVKESRKEVEIALNSKEDVIGASYSEKKDALVSLKSQGNEAQQVLNPVGKCPSDSSDDKAIQEMVKVTPADLDNAEKTSNMYHSPEFTKMLKAMVDERMLRIESLLLEGSITYGMNRKISKLEDSNKSLEKRAAKLKADLEKALSALKSQEEGKPQLVHRGVQVGASAVETEKSLPSGPSRPSSFKVLPQSLVNRATSVHHDKSILIQTEAVAASTTEPAALPRAPSHLSKTLTVCQPVPALVTRPTVPSTQVIPSRPQLSPDTTKVINGSSFLVGPGPAAVRHVVTMQSPSGGQQLSPDTQQRTSFSTQQPRALHQQLPTQYQPHVTAGRQATPPAIPCSQLQTSPSVIVEPHARTVHEGPPVTQRVTYVTGDKRQSPQAVQVQGSHRPVPYTSKTPLTVPASSQLVRKTDPTTSTKCFLKQHLQQTRQAPVTATVQPQTHVSQMNRIADAASISGMQVHHRAPTPVNGVRPSVGPPHTPQQSPPIVNRTFPPPPSQPPTPSPTSHQQTGKTQQSASADNQAGSSKTPSPSSLSRTAVPTTSSTGPTLPSQAQKTPPKPTVSIANVKNGIVLSWNMKIDSSHSKIDIYQLFAYQDTSAQPTSPSMWKKIGVVKALPLPMACTLTQFLPGSTYHFAVRAVDVNGRAGAFSDTCTITLPPKA